MKKHILCFLLLFSALASELAPTAFAAPDNSSHAAILVNADTGHVLYEQNSDEKMLIASTTKIMTALVVLDNCDPEETVVITPEYADVEGSSAYIEAGEETTVRELLYGLLMASGNDAATALAYYCAGSIDAFAQMMNEKAAALGLQNSSFRNPHGLDEDGHYSTAADLAVITCAALEYPLFAEIVSTKTYNSDKHSYMNHNKLLWSCEGCKGVKTGYTIAAGRSLVSCAERGGMTLVCVTLSDPDDWNDHMAMYDWAFGCYEYREVLPMGAVGSVPVISGTQDSVSVIASQHGRFLLEKNVELSYRVQLPEFVYAGIKAGEYAGEIMVYANGEFLAQFPLEYSCDVPVSDGLNADAWQRIESVWYMTNKFGLVLG